MKTVGVADGDVYACIIQSSPPLTIVMFFWTHVEKYKSYKASADPLRYVRLSDDLNYNLILYLNFGFYPFELNPVYQEQP